MGNLALNNEDFLEILTSKEEVLSDFVPILQLLKNLSYRCYLLKHDNLTEIFKVLYERYKSNEDIKIISKFMEQIMSYSEGLDYDELVNEINDLIIAETNSFSEALEDNSKFNFQIRKIGFNLSLDSGLRNCTSLEELIMVLLLFCKRLNDISSFLSEIKTILSDLIFDENIVDSIEELSDGFELRRTEIIYHLYCINNEIPIIIRDGYRGYQSIGNQMSIDCSPERNRDTVNNKLKKVINGINVNCELHTKMKNISNNAPDRIYFCPSLPVGIGDKSGKIFIYKITKHV